jgi:hypothetical protein
MKYYLIERPDGRIVLDTRKGEKNTKLEVIEADSWREARAAIPENRFFHDYGYGYCENPRFNAYQRERTRQERLRADEARLKKLFTEMRDGERRGRKAA